MTKSFDFLKTESALYVIILVVVTVLELFYVGQSAHKILNLFTTALVKKKNEAEQKTWG